MNNDDNNIILESGFSFKAKKIKFNQKGQRKVNFYSNRENDITESKFNKNLPDTIHENFVYKRVEKHSETKLRIIE